ncbi:MAG: hypothetical protein ACOCX2_11845 [Armatimonadota bacterium]
MPTPPTETHAGDIRWSRTIRPLFIGGALGLVLGWVVPMLLGPPVAAWGPTLRDDPRLSDAVVGAGGLLVYLSEAPGMYLAEHLTRTVPAEAVVNAIAWTLIGLTVGAWILAIRRGRALSIGAIGGLLLGWMLPALAGTLGECFRHCWMHEGFLGTIALAGGGALRAVGVLAELPWVLLAGEGPAVTPLPAIPVSAAVWTVIGTVCGAAIATLRHSSRDPEAAEGVGGAGVETAL